MTAGPENFVHIILDATGADTKLINDEGITWRETRKAEYEVKPIEMDDLVDQRSLIRFICR